VEIMALNPNKLQVTTHKQMQSLSEYTKLSMGNNILRFFDLKNNYENLDEDNTLDYFLSTKWANISTYHTTLQVTPCQFVFVRGMMHKLTFRENWDQIKKENRT
jgi:hypothetical protein